MDQINATLAEAIDQVTNSTTKPKSTPEGMAIAYGSLVVMALIPIFYGSFRSVGFQKEQKVCQNLSFFNLNNNLTLTGIGRKSRTHVP